MQPYVYRVVAVVDAGGEGGTVHEGATVSTHTARVLEKLDPALRSVMNHNTRAKDIS